ncbi:MAG TPA: hypothetical protein VMA77_32910, partial [Solirubrobacteraceae bacterium]|nr:hypothetical protein [Solirubrobacteraceae bacterium]
CETDRDNLEHPWCPLGAMTQAGAAGAREAILDAQLDAAASLSTAARASAIAVWASRCGVSSNSSITWP